MATQRALAMVFVACYHLVAQLHVSHASSRVFLKLITASGIACVDTEDVCPATTGNTLAAL